MRMWKVNPKIMCSKHLLGEHVECHMFLGAMRKGISLDGYINTNLFEVDYLIQRHAELTIEMVRRGYNHNSKLSETEYIKYKDNYKNVEVDILKAIRDLTSRCPDCEERYRQLKN